MKFECRLSRRGFGALLLGGAAAGLPWSSGCAVRPVKPTWTDGLRRADPETHGVDARGVLRFLDEVAGAGLELHSFMLYRHGHVLAEGWWWPYRPDLRHMTHSLTKSVAACGVGLAIDEGYFSLDDQVISFFEDELPPTVDPKLAAMTVRDLLTMQCGHGEFVSGSVWRQIPTSWVREFFKIPVVHQPGTTFVYTSAASFMLSAIVTKTTGQKLRDYLEPRFLQPLGITNLEWDESPGGINPGGNGLSWTTADTLKLGIVHLNRGRWQGRQLLPAQWVQEATRIHVRERRYGYHWWIGPGEEYFAGGAFSQCSIVFPSHDAVLAITAAISDTRFRTLIWNYFPAVFDSSPSDAAAGAALRERCEQLRVLPPLQATQSDLVQQISGRLYRMQSNMDGVETVRFEFTDSRCQFLLRDLRGEHRIAVGLNDWIEGSTTMTGHELHHQYQPDELRVVAGGRWLDRRTFEMVWQFVETAFQDRVVCRFDGPTMTLDRSVNVNVGATSRPTLHGRLSDPSQQSSGT